MNFIRKLFLLLLSIIPGIIWSQVSFIVADSVCINDSVIITNTSRDATTYYWNFCSGNLLYDPAGVNFPDPGTLNGPAFIDFAEDASGYYAFITNHSDGTITRYYYGNNLLNTPDAVNLGNFGGIIPDHVQGIQIVRDEGQYYAFVVGGQREESRIVRLDFGSSLSNIPIPKNLGNIGSSLDYPIDLYMFQENGNWYAYTVNFNSNTLTLIYFDQGLTGIPETTLTYGTNPQIFDRPTGFSPILVNGNWYIFVSNYGSNEITALDFGNSLLNIPSERNIGNTNYLYYPFDLTILRDCDRIFGFVLNRLGDIVRMDFNNGVNSLPDFTSLGEVGNLYNPQGISDVFRVGDTLYAFVANIDNNSITRLYFPGCNNASISSSTDRDPPPIKYNAPGNYNISLVINEGLPDQENYCQNITVFDSPRVDLGNDTVINPGSTITIDAGGNYNSYEWSTGEITPSIEVDMGGIYSVIVTNEYGCTEEDEIEIFIEVDIPNFFTPNGDGTNDTWDIPFLWNVPDALIQVFDRFGNLVVSYRAGKGAWNGTIKGEPVKDDTYWYVITIDNKTKPLKGSVTVKRL